MKKAIKIFTILDTTGREYKTKYYLREGNKDAERISKKKWFELYDKNVEVLPPVTLS